MPTLPEDKKDLFDQAIFAAMLLGHPWVLTPVNRQSLREGRTVVPHQMTIRSLAGSPFPPDTQDDIIESITRRATDHVELIINDAEKSGNDLEAYRTTLGLKYGFPALLEKLQEIPPSLLAEAITACAIFADAMTPKELTSNPVMHEVKSHAEIFGASTAYAIGIERPHFSALFSAVLPENMPAPKMTASIPEADKASGEERQYVFTFVGADRHVLAQLHRDLVKIAEETGVVIEREDTPEGPALIFRYTEPYKIVALADKAMVNSLLRRDPAERPWPL